MAYSLPRTFIGETEEILETQANIVKHNIKNWYINLKYILNPAFRHRVWDMDGYAIKSFSNDIKIQIFYVSQVSMWKLSRMSFTGNDMFTTCSSTEVYSESHWTFLGLWNKELF